MLVTLLCFTLVTMQPLKAAFTISGWRTFYDLRLTGRQLVAAERGAANCDQFLYRYHPLTAHIRRPLSRMAWLGRARAKSRAHLFYRLLTPHGLYRCALSDSSPAAVAPAPVAPMAKNGLAPL